MGKTVCKLLGLILLIVGLLGFTHILDPLGAHVGPAHATHNLVHIVSGVLALYYHLIHIVLGVGFLAGGLFSKNS